MEGYSVEMCQVLNRYHIRKHGVAGKSRGFNFLFCRVPKCRAQFQSSFIFESKHRKQCWFRFNLTPSPPPPPPLPRCRQNPGYSRGGCLLRTNVISCCSLRRGDVIVRVSAGRFSPDQLGQSCVCQSNMENRKRPREAALNSDDGFKTPEKRVSSVRLPDSDYMRWGVEETCSYLRREGLGRWEDIMRG